jgi:hypothetical protein
MDFDFDKVKRNYKRVPMTSMYSNLVEGKGNFLIRRGSECNELIFDGLHNVYATESKNFPSNKIFLFNLVNRDVKKFLKTKLIIAIFSEHLGRNISCPKELFMPKATTSY